MNGSVHAAAVRGRRRGAIGLALLLGMAGCGGDGVVGSGGTGQRPSYVVGTVNGFGSVIVDGVAFDDRAAVTVEEVAPGQDAIAAVQLGDRVSLDAPSVGVASVVRVDPALVGSVASVGAGGSFVVLGQSVSVNAGASSGPITQFGGGYVQAGDVRSGDAVEVHAIIVAQGGGYRLQATRVDKLATPPAWLRVTGIASATTGSRFSLGLLTIDASTASVLPGGTPLADGETVTVMGRSVLLTPGAGRTVLAAAQVRVRGFQSGSMSDISGSVAQLDTLARTFALGGLQVRYAGATVAPAGTPLANGAYVQVGGTVGSDGVLVAATVDIRNGASGSQAQVRGNIRGFDPATKRFTVRGVNVDAAAATLQGCPSTGLADTLFVEVDGTLGSAGVLAATVQCEGEPPDATVEREGTASAVDTVAKTFSLLPESGASIPIQWTAATYFRGVSPATLSGQSLQVQGAIANGVLVATKVEVDD